MKRRFRVTLPQNCDGGGFFGINVDAQILLAKFVILFVQLLHAGKVEVYAHS